MLARSDERSLLSYIIIFLSGFRSVFNLNLVVTGGGGLSFLWTGGGRGLISIVWKRVCSVWIRYCPS